MKLFSGVLFALLFVGCQSDDQSLVESPSNPLINAQNDSSDVEKTVEEVEQNDLKDLKECIEFATFKSPLIPCLKEFRDEMIKHEPSSIDSIYLMTFNKLDELALTVYFDEDRDYDRDTWKLKKGVAERYLESGFVLDQEEGMYFLVVDDNFLLGQFRDIVTPELRKYLEFRATYPTKITYDAGLILSPQDFAERLILLEELLQNDNQLVQDLVQPIFSAELSMFFMGTDNTPAFDWSDEHPYYPENKAAVIYLKENGLPIAKKYATIVHNTLEESGWSVDTDSFYLLATQKAIAKDLKNR